MKTHNLTPGHVVVLFALAATLAGCASQGVPPPVIPLDDQLRIECLNSYAVMGDPEIVAKRDEFLARRDQDRATT